jgi:hypothetical protein
VLVIEDFSQDLDVRVTFTHKAVWESEDESIVVTDEDYKFLLSGSTGTPKDGGQEGTTNRSNDDNGQEDDDDDDEVVVVVSTRRRTPDENGEGPARKKAKLAAVPEADVISIDD